MRYVSIWPLSHDILEWYLHPNEEGNQWNILGAKTREKVEKIRCMSEYFCCTANDSQIHTHRPLCTKKIAFEWV